MAKLTITEAIKRSPVGRSQFYAKYVEGGLITISVDGSGKKYVESSELLRCFGEMKGMLSSVVRFQSSGLEIGQHWT
jgi:hypothetical protein